MPRALWFVSPGRVELRPCDVPEPGSGQVLAEARFSAVSHGTEGLLLRGTGPDPFDPSLDEPGTPTYPRRYGYAWVGRVLDGALPRGSAIFALANHAEQQVLDVSHVRLLPSTLPELRATLAASMETAINTVWDAGIGLGDHVLVLGGGSVGSLCAYLAQRAGASRVVLSEPSEARRSAAKALGIVNAVEALGTGHSATGGAHRARYDVVIEATGKPELVDDAIAACAREGRVVITSFYGTACAPIRLGERFHRERLTLCSSQVSLVARGRRARFDFARRFEVVLEQLAAPCLDALFEPPTPFERAPHAYERLLHHPRDVRQLAFEY